MADSAQTETNNAQANYLDMSDEEFLKAPPPVASATEEKPVEQPAPQEKEGTLEEPDEPGTEEEQEALTVLDKIGFKIRRMLGSRISELSSFAYVKSIPDKYQDLLATNSVEKKAMVKRVTKDIHSLSENHNMSFDEIVKIYLNESLKG